MELLNKLLKGDKGIWAIYFFLCAISIIEVFSAASTLTYKSGNHWAPISNHIIIILVGAVVVWAVHLIPYKWFKIFPVFLLPISILLLIFISVMGYTSGDRVNGAARWTEFMGISFQPSEFAKMAVILGVAFFLSKDRSERDASPMALKYILWCALPTIIFIAIENLSTAMLLFLVVYLMMFIGSIPRRQQIKLTGGLFIIGFLGLTVLFITPNDTNLPLLHRFPTWKNRIMKFNDEKIPAAQFDMDNDAQEAHARIAIARSNVVGVMPGNSVQRDFLSQAFSDFIFAIIIEEMGLVGGLFVICLYIWLLVRVGRIAKRCDKYFPAFLVMGIALLLVSQAVLNMLVAVGLFPITGQPLPLISKGGTSTLVNCVYIGMILSVSRYTIYLAEQKKKEEEEERLRQERELESLSAENEFIVEEFDRAGENLLELNIEQTEFKLYEKE